MTPVEEVKGLLATVGSIRVQHEVAWRDTATRFNIFDALNIEYRELSHSKFLAFLLNPNQLHDQGDRFLRSFLALIGVAVPDSLEHVEVITEHPIPPYGQLDLLIRIPAVLTICVENKVGARDQENQISRYLNWLNSHVIATGIRAAVYLTPRGGCPQESLDGVDASPLRRLSYEQIANWIERQSYPDHLGHVTGMYVQTCRRIAGVAMKNSYTDEIGGLLRTPQHFAIALDIAQFIAEERARVIERFWQNVRSILLARMSAEGVSGRWTIELSRRLIVDNSWLAIVPVGVRIDQDTGVPLCYSILAECLSSGQSCCYGIRRRSKKNPDAPNRLDEIISHELTADFQFTENNWFCGWRKFSDEGVFVVTPDEKEWLVQLNGDNHSTGVPLATEVAEDLWGLFVRFGDRLEQLNAPNSSG